MSKPKEGVNLKWRKTLLVVWFFLKVLHIVAVSKAYLGRIVGPWSLWDKSVTWSFLSYVFWYLHYKNENKKLNKIFNEGGTNHEGAWDGCAYTHVWLVWSDLCVTARNKDLDHSPSSYLDTIHNFFYFCPICLRVELTSVHCRTSWSTLIVRTYWASILNFSHSQCRVEVNMWC